MAFGFRSPPFHKQFRQMPLNILNSFDIQSAIDRKDTYTLHSLAEKIFIHSISQQWFKSQTVSNKTKLLNFLQLVFSCNQHNSRNKNQTIRAFEKEIIDLQKAHDKKEKKIRKKSEQYQELQQLYQQKRIVLKQDEADFKTMQQCQICDSYVRNIKNHMYKHQHETSKQYLNKQNFNLTEQILKKDEQKSLRMRNMFFQNQKMMYETMQIFRTKNQSKKQQREIERQREREKSRQKREMRREKQRERQRQRQRSQERHKEQRFKQQMRQTEQRITRRHKQEIDRIKRESEEKERRLGRETEQERKQYETNKKIDLLSTQLLFHTKNRNLEQPKPSNLEMTKILQKLQEMTSRLQKLQTKQINPTVRSQPKPKPKPYQTGSFGALINPQNNESVGAGAQNNIEISVGPAEPGTIPFIESVLYKGNQQVLRRDSDEQQKYDDSRTEQDCYLPSIRSYRGINYR